MGPSPTIPTSFVPKQPVKSAARFSKTGGNTFLVFSLFMLGVAVVGAIGVFAYGQYLGSVDRAKSAELASVESSIDSDQVEGFIRARDRFNVAGSILDRHVALSNFFEVLESLTLVNVRFDSFSFTLLPDGSADINLTGNARSFNALAAQSSAFSANKDIKRAIFSGIQVSETGTVSFDVKASLESDLLAFGSMPLPAVQKPVQTPAAPVVASSSPKTATSTATTTKTNL